MPFILLCILVLNAPLSKTITFDIIYKDRVVGEMSATLERSGKRKIYRNTTQVRARVIGQIEMQYESRTVFQDGILQEASVRSFLNGDVYSDVETRKSGNEYQFYKNGKLQNTLQGPITYTALQMLFEEPGDIGAAYSEEAGAFHQIEADGKNRYNKINSKGRSNFYYYESNNLERIEIDAGLVELTMMRDD